ncbi:unnamed protein product [Trichobilharzia regenti]|nr:unnamed protein product [Trichobilharzia regenti]
MLTPSCDGACKPDRSEECRRAALKVNNYSDKLIRRYVGKCKNKINNNSSDGDNNNNINDMYVKHSQDNDNTKNREYKS